MKRLMLILVILVGCQPLEPSVPEQAEESMVTLVENLDTPWAIDFLPDGTMIFTERNGDVYLYDGELELVGTIDVYQRSESGLHGVAVDPEFDSNGYVYLYYTYEDGNRVSRFVLGSELSDETVLLEGIPNARYHDGGRIKFGPDGLLYITTGDATTPSSSQDVDSLAGKILRMNRDGSVPSNPFGNYAYSYGHRNPQGLAWGDVMYSAEHGPTRHDEVNVIVEGGNYGWPSVCGGSGIQPLRCYTDETIAPSGIAYYDGSLYVAGLRGERLVKLVIVNNSVVSEEVVVDDIGRIREVVAYNGSLYIATSNRDGRGRAREGDDRIVRLVV